MAKRDKSGQEFEKLVTAVQMVLSDRGVVTPNARRYDHDAKCHRQIDVAVEVRDGDQTVFTMIEVKDYTRRVDVQTIDKVVTVRDGVRADVAVVVSRNGFTAAARAKAEANNVRLRALRELTADDWLSTLVPKFIHVQQLLCEPHELHILDEDMRPLALGGPLIEYERHFFDATGNPTPVAFRELIELIRNTARPEHMKDFDPNGPPQSNFALVRLQCNNGSLYLPDTDGVLREVRFAALVGAWHVHHNQAPLTARKYTGDNATRGATVFESRFTIAGASYALQAVIPDPKHVDLQ